MTTSAPRRPILAALTLLASCQHHPPIPLEPTERLARLLDRSGSVRSDAPPSAAAARSEWFPLAVEVDPGDGLALDEWNTLALWYAPEIVSARGDQRRAEARLITAGLLPNPTFSASPVTSLRGNGSIIPLQLTWPLPLYGLREANEDAARLAVETEELRLQAVELDVLGRVRELLMEVWFADEILRIRERSLDQLRPLIEQFDSLEESGSLSVVDAWNGRSSLADAEAAAIDARFERDSAERRLCALCGVLPDTELEIVLDESIALSIAELISESEPLDTVSDTSMFRLPTLRALERGYERAEAVLRREIAAQYPRFTLGPATEVDGGEPLPGVSGTLEIPLFEFNEGGIAAALAARDSARNAYDHGLLANRHRLAEASAAASRARRALEKISTATSSSLEPTLKALTDRIRAGVAQPGEVVDTLADLVSTRVREIERTRDLSRAQLRVAVESGLVLPEPQPQPASASASDSDSEPATTQSPEEGPHR